MCNVFSLFSSAFFSWIEKGNEKRKYNDIIVIQRWQRCYLKVNKFNLWGRRLIFPLHLSNKFKLLFYVYLEIDVGMWIYWGSLLPFPMAPCLCSNPSSYVRELSRCSGSVHYGPIKVSSTLVIDYFCIKFDKVLMFYKSLKVRIFCFR